MIGHITRDLYNGGYKLGGTATFSALTARALGLRAAIITSNGPDMDLDRLPADVLIELRPCAQSTTFQNLYRNGHRQQHIGSQAALLRPLDVPPGWRAPPVVHLGPVAREVDLGLVDAFPGSLLGITPQGWMRTWNRDGIVQPTTWDPPDALLARADVVILSREDVGDDMDRVMHYAERTRLLVLTAGWKGATVYHGGSTRAIAAPKVAEVDPTGAGDIFAAAMLVALHRSGDPYLVASFANCVAAHSVERSGIDSIPTPAEVARCRALFGG
ncbi:MAG: ribokinase [Anaerolineae bacterium]|nr:ribokinase [Anaerolineae bacterium]